MLSDVGQAVIDGDDGSSTGFHFFDVLDGLASTGSYRPFQWYFRNIHNIPPSIVTHRMSQRKATTEADVEEDIREHVENIAPGAGCAEIWEQLTEQRTDD